MLISALDKYYEHLSAANKVCPDGCSYQKVSHLIMLKPDGSIGDIVDIRRPGKPDKKGKVKYEPVEMLLPKRTQKPAIDFNIIEHRPLYIFGLNYDKKSKKFTADDPKNKARNSHECFVKGNLEYTEGMMDETVIAYRRFIENWNPEDETENKHLLKIANDYGSAYFCFAPDGHPEKPLNDTENEIMKRVMNTADVDDGEMCICPVLGEKLSAARIHNKIKGVSGGNSSGGLLVCFNSTAEESYGKKQSYNSGISSRAMNHYTEALNVLLSDRRHRTSIDDMTIVFFAMSDDDTKEVDLFREMLGDSSGVSPDDIENILNMAFVQLKKGLSLDLKSVGIDDSVMFYIAGFTPNNSRIAQKFFCSGTYGSILSNVAVHQLDMKIDGSKGQIPLWRIIKELKLAKTRDEKVPNPLLASIFSAIIYGSRYPEMLLETAVRRVKVDKNVNSVRAGIIKGCINRKQRFNKEKEEIEMSLDINNNSQAYLCGRLFAVLEKIQQNASNMNINNTIKDSFFASACAKPCAVFPRLVTLAQYHLKKDKYSVSNNKLIGEIIDKLNGEFPATLSLTEQGEFIIGYYQQYENYFKKNTKDEQNAEQIKEENNYGSN